MGIERRVRSGLPGNVQRFQAALRGPHVVTYHSREVIEHLDLTDPRYRLCPGVINAVHLAAKLRTDGQGREFHAGQHDVHAVHDPAIHLIGRVQPLQRPPDQLEVLDGLQRRILRRSQPRGLVDQRAVGKPLAAAVNHFAALGATALRIGVPDLGRRLHQQGTGARAGLAQGHPECPHRVRIAGHLETKSRIVVQLIVRRGVFHDYLLHRGIELLRQNHRDGGIDALPHLHLGHDQRHDRLLVDPNVRIGLETSRRNRGSLALAKRQIEPKE